MNNTEHPDLKILIAEDNEIVQDLLVGMLERMGYNPDSVSNGIELLQAVSAKNYDLVFTDLRMPEMNGIEATLHIRKEIPEDQQPVIIAVSNYSEQLQKGIEAGIRGFINKPVSYEQLARVISIFDPKAEEMDFSIDDAPKNEFIDLSNLYEMAGDNKAFIQDILNKIISRLPNDMNAIGMALRNDAPESLRKAAHKARGCCGYTGANELLGLLNEIEISTVAGIPKQEVQAVFDRAMALSMKVMKALEQEAMSSPKA